jgi:hypothetical protein
MSESLECLGQGAWPYCLARRQPRRAARLGSLGKGRSANPSMVIKAQRGRGSLAGSFPKSSARPQRFLIADAICVARDGAQRVFVNLK